VPPILFTFRGNVPIRALGLSKTYKDIAFDGAFLRGSMWLFCNAIRQGTASHERVMPNSIRLN
jgi:hypothetical protein